MAAHHVSRGKGASVPRPHVAAPLGTVTLCLAGRRLRRGRGVEGGNLGTNNGDGKMVGVQQWGKRAGGGEEETTAKRGRGGRKRASHPRKEGPGGRFCFRLVRPPDSLGHVGVPLSNPNCNDAILHNSAAQGPIIPKGYNGKGRIGNKERDIGALEVKMRKLRSVIVKERCTEERSEGIRAEGGGRLKQGGQFCITLLSSILTLHW